MKRVVLTLVFILLVVLIWPLRKERYTLSDVGKIDSYFFPRYPGANGDNIKIYIVKSVLNELDGNRELELSNINMLVDTLNSNGFTFSHYSNVTELDTMFETAYTSGEPGLGTRDRMILRSFAYPGIDMAVDRNSNLFAITYTSDGVPDYMSTIVSESGKTSKDILKLCFVVIDKLFSTEMVGNPWTPEIIDYINSLIPDKYAPKFDRTNNMSVMNGVTNETPTPAALWFVKAVTVGPAYLAWLSENKWKLDLNWNP